MFIIKAHNSLNQQIKELSNIDDNFIEIDIVHDDLNFLQDLSRKLKIEYFNLRMGKGQSMSFSLLKKQTKEAKMGVGKSFSIQTFTEGGWGLAVGKFFNRKELELTFKKAASLAHWSSKYSDFKDKYSIKSPYSKDFKYKLPKITWLSSKSPEDIISTLRSVEDEAYTYKEIVSTSLRFNAARYEYITYNSQDRFTRTQTANIYFGIQAVAKDGTNQQGYHATYGKPGGIEHLDNIIGLGKEVASSAVELLNSKPLPAGKYDIIMDPLLTGTFIHEAFGHASEADAILAGESILAGKLNTKVGNELINIYDDGTKSNEYGFIPVDDEGTPGQKTILVEDGILKNHLHSLETAAKMDVNPTGNGRASSISVRPLVRMTNTYLAPGDATLDELMKEMKNGILTIGWKYGYTDPIDGSFQFKCAKAYLIENGEKTQILRDTAISGLTLDVLSRVKMISKDLEMDAGYCGKMGQSVEVGSGGPYTYIKDMIMGGQ